MKGKHPYAEALAVAEKLKAQLSPFCERIEIAGSLRRRCETVGDIEIVAIPKVLRQEGLFGPVGKGISMLDVHLAKFPEVYRQVRAGERLKELRFEGYQVDLFLTTREQWGVIFTLRTGSADFSKWLVTSREQGGGRMNCRYVNEGRVWRRIESRREPGSPEPGTALMNLDGSQLEAMETPEERDVFEALGVDWVPLEKRDKGYWRWTGDGRQTTEEEKARDYV